MNVNKKYWPVYTIMLLNTAHADARVYINNPLPPKNDKHITITIPEPEIEDTVRKLEHSGASVSIQEANGQVYIQVDFQPVRKSLSEIDLTKSLPRHIDILNWDLTVEQIVLASKSNPSAFKNVYSIDLSRLNIGDSELIAVLNNFSFPKLKWLNLAGNREITRTGVSNIAEQVCSKALVELEWLELLGTSCDATPYVDGFRWRMSEISRNLAQTYGFQSWMMLGSRKAEFEFSEVLPKSELTNPNSNRTRLS